MKYPSEVYEFFRVEEGDSLMRFTQECRDTFVDLELLKMDGKNSHKLEHQLEEC